MLLMVTLVKNAALVLVFIASLFLLSACQSATRTQHVETLYVNGVIWTGVTGQADASVLAVKDGEIVYVGNKVPPALNADSTVDLDGHFVMSGFMDNHVHFMEGGAALASVDLRTVATPVEFAAKIADFTKPLAKGQWVLNGNWDHTVWGGELPHRDWIDEVTQSNPVYVIRIDGHMALANSAALRAAGISKDTKDPDGGVIVRDDSGRATGVLKGNALNLVLRVIPPPSDDELMTQFQMAQKHALSLGIVKVHAVTAYPTETTMLDIFQMAQARGIMKLRAKVSTPIEDWKSMNNEVEKLGRGDHQLNWGGVKGFIDGSLGARTAWMYQPYADEPSTRGVPLNNPDKLKDLMQRADSHGLELSIHAIGDRGIDSVIDSMKLIAGEDIRDKRYRIEHFQHPSKRAVKDIASLGIIASMHPYHAIDDGRWVEDRIGSERLETTYAFRSIIDAGAVLTFGSDWPVAPLSPVDGVYAAVTRRTLDGANHDGWIPEQKIDVEEALAAYTVNNAYAFGEEDVAGTLERNKRADFVVLSEDPRVIEHEKIRYIRVLSTVIGGELVYKHARP